MEKMKVIELKESVLEDNDQDAAKLREELRSKGICLLNLMSSPGSGKTTTLVRTIKELNEYNIGVMECDIDADVDAYTIREAGARSIQLHTGGMCHMDAGMTKQGMNEMGMDGLDIVFIENVGNLVCPAEFDTGASINMTILSVPEGDDKPAKYPLIYEVCDIVLVNKIDAMAVFDFDKDLCVSRIKELNPDAKVFFVSSKTGEGFDEWLNYLRGLVNDYK